MLKKLNLAIVALFVVAGASQAGVLNDAILTSWRNGLATRDISGSNIVTALATVGANIKADADSADNNYIRDFVTRGADGLDGSITNLTSLTKDDGAALTAAVNNFFTKVAGSFALKSIASYKNKWLARLKKVTDK